MQKTEMFQFQYLTTMYMRQVKIKKGLKFFNLGRFSISFVSKLFIIHELGLGDKGNNLMIKLIIFIRRLSMIIWVRVVLNRTVVVDSD